MGNKDKRKEKKKPKQPKAAPKPATPSRFGSAARPTSAAAAVLLRFASIGTTRPAVVVRELARPDERLRTVQGLNQPGPALSPAAPAVAAGDGRDLVFVVIHDPARALV